MYNVTDNMVLVFAIIVLDACVLSVRPNLVSLLLLFEKTWHLPYTYIQFDICHTPCTIHICCFMRIVWWGVGAGEDVEGVLARLQAQASENALLRERQAKASSDLQVHPPTYSTVLLEVYNVCQFGAVLYVKMCVS